MAKKKEEEKKEFQLQEGQVVEVEYDKDMVQDFIDHEGELIEGVGAEGDDDGNLYGTQTTVNTDSMEELLGEGAEIEYVCEEN